MKNLAIVWTLCLMTSGCENDQPPEATRDEVLAACSEYNEAACRAFGRCLGWTAVEIDECIEDEQSGCENELEAEVCWTNQRDAFERCSEIEDESCADVCNDDGFCFDYCPYFCPGTATERGEVEAVVWSVAGEP